MEKLNYEENLMQKVAKGNTSKTRKITISDNLKPKNRYK